MIGKVQLFDTVKAWIGDRMSRILETLRIRRAEGTGLHDIRLGRMPNGHLPNRLWGVCFSPISQHT